MLLHLGVIDQPYTDAKGQTTGDVAEILEAKYEPMGLFVETHEQDIADDLTDSVQGAIESLMLGAPPSLNPFGEAESKIAEHFKDFITTQEFEYVSHLRGPTLAVPTQAALDGVNHRLKRKRGPRRPSLQDTSLYVDSTVAWVE